MKRLVVGKIIGTHGLRGEAKVYILTDYPEDRFIKGETVYLDDTLALEIEHVRYHKGNALITFVGKHSINDVEQYKGMKVFMDVTEDAHEGYFYYELVGSTIIDESDNVLGVVDSILSTVAHDILKVKKANGKFFMVPYVDAFIVEERVDDKQIVVSLIPGMNDED